MWFFRCLYYLSLVWCYVHLPKPVQWSRKNEKWMPEKCSLLFKWLAWYCLLEAKWSPPNGKNTSLYISSDILIFQVPNFSHQINLNQKWFPLDSQPLQFYLWLFKPIFFSLRGSKDWDSTLRILLCCQVLTYYVHIQVPYFLN